MPNAFRSFNALPGAAALIACVAAASAAPSINPPAVSSVHVPTPAQRTEKRTVLRAALQKSVDALDRRVAAGDKNGINGITGRDVSNGALAHLLLKGGADAPQAEALVRRLLAEQDNDPKSPTWGKLPWSVGNNEIQDENSIEFGTQAWGPMLLGYGDKLSPQFKTELLQHFPAAFATLRRHPVKVSYTNIFLMKTVCMVLMGEAANDDKAANEGYAALDTWLAYTRENGIHEFGSPTYYATSMGSLLNGYRFARRPGAREKFKQALDIFWADIAAHYFAGQESLSGPHSRDYDFLTSTGGGILYMYSEGMRSYDTIDSIDLEKTHLVMNQEPGGYHPGAFVYDLANTPEKIVQERWDSTPDQIRYTYITPGFSVGSTSRNSGPQDKQINIELAGKWPDAKRLPDITIEPDDTDSPYGKAKFKDKSGHSKPRHLPLNPVAVQNKGDLLVLTDVNSRNAREGTTSLATNIILPSKADAVTIGTTKVSVAKPFSRPLSFGEVVGVRSGHAAVVVRVFPMSGLGEQSPSLVLQAEPDGLRDGALRLTAYHWKGQTLPPPADVRVVTLFLTAPCSNDAEYAALVRRAESATLDAAPTPQTNVETVSVHMGSSVFSAGYDRVTRLPAERTVNGQPISPVALLSVNHKEVGVRLLPAAAQTALRR